MTGVATLAALRTALLAEIAQQIQITSLADIDNWQGWASFLTATANANPVIIDFAALEAGAEDRRPWLRHTATLVINGMLRVLVGFRGTDTHGLKAFRRVALIDTVRSFASRR